MLPRGELTAPPLQFWGGISFLLFSSGSLAPALHRGPGLISYLLQRIFCYVSVGDGVSGVLVFTAGFASQPVGAPGTSSGHSGTAFILSLIPSFVKCIEHPSWARSQTRWRRGQKRKHGHEWKFRTIGDGAGEVAGSVPGRSLCQELRLDPVGNGKILW